MASTLVKAYLSSHDNGVAPRSRPPSASLPFLMYHLFILDDDEGGALDVYREQMVLGLFGPHLDLFVQGVTVAAPGLKVLDIHRVPIHLRDSGRFLAHTFSSEPYMLMRISYVGMVEPAETSQSVVPAKAGIHFDFSFLLICANQHNRSLPRPPSRGIRFLSFSVPSVALW